ncbi:MAG: hypothetical protein M3179_07105, partial [Actinomycetota bacterium]|nr:hypothetical protein [Actinomycetota bacterium]
AGKQRTASHPRPRFGRRRLAARTTGTRRRRVGGRGLLVAALVLEIMQLSAPARSQGTDPVFDVTVVIERMFDLHDDADCCDGADFFAEVFFDSDAGRRTPMIEDRRDVTEDFAVTKPAVPLSRGSVPITIVIWDEDGGLNGPDNIMDADPDAGEGDEAVNFAVNLNDCLVSGEVQGGCSQTLTSQGDAGDEAARVEFRVEITDPESAPGLRLRCLHNQIWPQNPGEQVTITATALDGALSNSVRADQLEIFVDDRQNPVVALASSVSGSYTFNPTTSFSYACRMVENGQPVSTGWRTVTVGQDSSLAVPVLYTGNRRDALDFVFVPDVLSYTGPQDPAFLGAVFNVINQAYYGAGGFSPFDIFLTNQKRLNFWISSSAGRADDAGDGCDHLAPEYSFADAHVLLHTRPSPFRDCAPGGKQLFSGPATGINTIRHETGHRPFGLADEYCPSRATNTCDGGYFEAEEGPPNLWEEPEDCAADAPGLGNPPPACRGFTEDDTDFLSVDDDWFLSDPPTNDLMVDNTRPQAMDVRRINWMFEQCRSSRC